MLKINAKQQAALGRSALADFEGRMLAHLKRFSPRHLRIVGDRELLGMITTGNDHANLHEFTSERSVRIFVEMMLMFGIGFDADPQHPWADEPLRARDDEHLRADRLHAAAWRHIDDTAADDLNAAGVREAGHASAPLRQFAQETARPPSDPSAWDLRVRLTARTRRLFPRKCAHIGEPALTRSVDQAVAMARSFRLTSERGLSVFTGISLILGAEFFHDPQFLWAKRTLSADGIDDEQVRVERLLGETNECLDRWWT